MFRVEIEQQMKMRGTKRIDLVTRENDSLGFYCELKAGILYDYTGHRVDRKTDFWGYLVYVDGAPRKKAFNQK